MCEIVLCSYSARNKNAPYGVFLFLLVFYIVSDNQGNGLIKQRRYNIIMTVQYIHRVAYHGTTKTRCGWQHVNETGRDRSQI